MAEHANGFACETLRAFWSVELRWAHSKSEKWRERFRVRNRPRALHAESRTRTIEPTSLAASRFSRSDPALRADFVVSAAEVRGDRNTQNAPDFDVLLSSTSSRRARFRARFLDDPACVRLRVSFCCPVAAEMLALNALKARQAAPNRPSMLVSSPRCGASCPLTCPCSCRFSFEVLLSDANVSPGYLGLSPRVRWYVIRARRTLGV